MTQCDMVLKHLKAGRVITSMQSFRLYEITRLPDRIRDLRAKGHRIHAAMCTLPSKKRVAVYSIS